MKRHSISSSGLNMQFCLYYISLLLHREIDLLAVSHHSYLQSVTKSIHNFLSADIMLIFAVFFTNGLYSSYLI